MSQLQNSGRASASLHYLFKSSAALWSFFLVAATGRLGHGCSGKHPSHWCGYHCDAI